MTSRLHEDRHAKYGCKRKIAAAVYTAREERKRRVRKTPNGLFGIIRQSDTDIEPSDARNKYEHERKPKQRVKNDRRRYAKAGVMQRLVHATRWLEDRPGKRKERKPNNGPCRPYVVAKREKEQRRNRQQGKVRRQSVLRYRLLHLSTSDAFRPCRGSGRSRSCARGHCRRRTCRSGTRRARIAGGSG
jgi:hypothetical protein